MKKKIFDIVVQLQEEEKQAKKIKSTVNYLAFQDLANHFKI